MPGIKCQVEECIYQQGAECHADAIEVLSSGDRIVDTSDGTQCKTFKPKRYDNSL